FALVEDIHKSLNDISGKQFYSETHRLLKDREYLIIAPLTKEEDTKFGADFFINKYQIEIKEPLNLEFSVIVNSDKFVISKNSSIATLNYSKLDFPLVLRKWKNGDYFYPFGMNKKKKLSDFFIDEKLSIIDKENIWLVCSAEKIVWIIGHRIDNRFRIGKNTKQIFQIAKKEN
ncbi:tRNA lysidine(34) synthetase TilS, partial [Bacteroidota bacterium]